MPTILPSNLPNEPFIRPSPPPPYRRIVVSFLVAVVAVTAFIMYHTLGHATIILSLSPSREKINTTLTVNQASPTDSDGPVIVQTEHNDTKNFAASPSGERDDKATGTVTIINTNSSPQTLIATTRLLSLQGILFRLQKTVSVPAGGRVQANVIADQPGTSSEVSPTRFTIPGLKSPLREKIYATSENAMTRAAKTGGVITEGDIDTARRSLRDAFTPPSLAKLRELLPKEKREWSVVYTSEITNARASAQPGDKASEFSYTATVKVVAVFYNPTTIREQTLAALQNDLTLGRKVITIDEPSVEITIKEIESTLASATLNVALVAQVAISDPEKIINKTDLTGRTKDEVKDYFASIPGVKNAEVTLTPFWVTTIPTLTSRITLEAMQ